MAAHQNRILIAALVGVALVVLAFFLQPVVVERLAPRLRSAVVAVEVASSGVAELGPVEIEIGTPFTLHAVIEAFDRGGEPVYYTEAPGLRIDGRDVDPAQLRRWDRSREARVRWFTVEGSPPFIQLTAPEDLERFVFEELYRPNWPLAWSVPGRIEPAKDDHLADESSASSGHRHDFGTQRYMVSVEFYGISDELLPVEIIRSWGAADVEREAERFATVRRVLPGRLAPASRVFGLTQIEVSAVAGGFPRRGTMGWFPPRIGELARRGLAFSRSTVIRDQIRASGRRFDELRWRTVDLVAGEGRWDETAAPGDLLRAGERIVVLYEDRGEPGRLDYDDLCFDFVQGPAVRPLSEVFSGDGVVELASLGG